MTYPMRPIPGDISEMIASSRFPEDRELFEAIWEITVGVSKVHIYDAARDCSMCGSVIDLHDPDWVLVRAVDRPVLKQERCRRCEVTKRAHANREAARSASAQRREAQS